LFHAWQKTISVLNMILSVFVFVIGHILVFPIDCLFLLYDIFLVNWRQVGLFGAECRDVQGRCASANKYTNTWMFNLFVCPNNEKHSTSFTCVASHRQTHLIRGLLGLIFLLGLTAGGGALLLWPSTRESTTQSGVVRTAKQMKRLAEAARTAFAHEDYQAALEHHEQLLKISPDHREALFRAGICLERTGELDHARLCYHRASRGEGGLPQAALRLAASYYRGGRVYEAGYIAERALEMGISDAAAHAMVAQVKLMHRQPLQADRHMKLALEKDPDHNIVMAARAKVLVSRLKDPVGSRTAQKIPIRSPAAYLASVPGGTPVPEEKACRGGRQAPRDHRTVSPRPCPALFSDQLSPCRRREKGGSVKTADLPVQLFLA
jgi:hypothetical protein